MSYPQQFGVPSSPALAHQTADITGGNQVTARVATPRPSKLATQHATCATRNDEDCIASYCKSCLFIARSWKLTITIVGTSVSSSPSEQKWLPTSPNSVSQHSEMLQIENHVTAQEVISQHEHAFHVLHGKFLHSTVCSGAYAIADPAFLPPFEVPSPGVSTSQPADITDLEIPVKAQRDILKISACIEARKPMWKLSELEYLGHAYGEEDSEGKIPPPPLSSYALLTCPLQLTTTRRNCSLEVLPAGDCSKIHSVERSSKDLHVRVMHT